MNIKKNPKRLCLGIFDIDGTIFRSSLTVELVNALFKRGIFPISAKNRMEDEYLLWLNRKGAYDDYLQSLVQIFFDHIKGIHQDNIEEISGQIIKWQNSRIYRYTRDLISSLKRKKYFLIAISGSPSFIVDKFARRMNFDRSFGIQYQVEKKFFTGKIINKDALSNKKKVLFECIGALNIDVDLSNSIAVGDTVNDIDLLKSVGNPIVFNPTKELADYAAKRSWTIVVERKDAIYKINDFSLIKSL